MFGSNVLETAIGLVFVFLSVSLVCTAVNELIAAAFASRSRDLERGIRNMLDGTSEFPLRWWTWTWMSSWSEQLNAAKAKATPWAEKFFNHHIIDGVRKDNSMPSYIPSQDFVNVLLELVDEDVRNPPLTSPPQSPPGPLTSPPPSPLRGDCTFDEIRAMVNMVSSKRIREMLLPIVREAESDLNTAVAPLKRFAERVEIWFDNGMDRVGGWYKRRTQGILLLVGLFIAVALNIDTISIYQRLARDGTLRTSIVAVAEQASAQHRDAKGGAPPTTQSISDAVKAVEGGIDNIDHLGIPIGWRISDYDSFFAHDEKGKNGALLPSAVLSKIFGLLATALAASLGAPFWFDLLNKFMSIRGNGKAPEEKPKNPKVVLQPQAPTDE
ncbi:MAG TPA: hypothetical protein VFC46_00690 [Humisphaera sp.]|nr:hypothetical protein [Humisphaera sp.]